MSNVTTLWEFLENAAERNPALAYVGSEPVTWAGVQERALAFAGLLEAQGCTKGSRLILALPPGPDYLVAFFGAMAAGVLPLGVPAQVGPKPIWELPDQLAVYDKAFEPWGYVGMRPVEDPARRWLTVAMSQGHAPGTLVRPTAADVAFLGLTSGTGGELKAVMIEHGLTMQSLGRFARQFRLSAESRFLTWIPYHHASGFTATLMAAAAGAAVVGMSPAAVATNLPALFQALSEHRTTHSFIPSFLIKAMLHLGVQNLGEIDLSQVVSLQIGGERIDPVAVASFERLMAPLGLSSGVVTNCYGMIEATAIALAEPGRTPPVDRLMTDGFAETGVASPESEGDLHVAGIGRALEGVEIRIVVDGQVVGDRRVGEIHARGADVGRAYWGNPAATAARWLDGWLHTGDMGYLADGTLYVCGRLNDVITIAARKYSAEDIEAVLARLPAIAGAPLAAVGVPDAVVGTESLAVVIGVTDQIDQQAATKAIQSALRERFGVPATRIRFTPVMALPRTANGKVSRLRCRQALVSDSLPSIN